MYVIPLQHRTVLFSVDYPAGPPRQVDRFFSEMALVPFSKTQRRATSVSHRESNQSLATFLLLAQRSTKSN